jgi:hypothetical protein
MNSKRGFRRIAVVLALAVAICCAGLSIVLILNVRDDAQSYLRWKKENYIKNYCYGITPEQAQAELERRKRIEELKVKYQKQGVELTSSEPKYELVPLGPASVEEVYEQELKEQQKQKAEMELSELENRFWVKLSKSSLIGLCVAGSLVGGIVGFIILCLMYKLLEWLVLGFCGE